MFRIAVEDLGVPVFVAFCPNARQGNSYLYRETEIVSVPETEVPKRNGFCRYDFATETPTGRNEDRYPDSIRGNPCTVL